MAHYDNASDKDYQHSGSVSQVHRSNVQPNYKLLLTELLYKLQDLLMGQTELPVAVLTGLSTAFLFRTSRIVSKILISLLFQNRSRFLPAAHVLFAIS